RRPAHWLFYLGLFIIGWLPVFNSPYAHYLIIMMPVWAVIAAVSLDSLGERLALLAGRTHWGSRVVVILAALAVVSLCWPARDYYFLSPAGIVAKRYGPANPFVESPHIAGRIRELTGPQDKIFIAGSEPQILFYAKRRGVSRFGGVYGLMMDQPRALEFQRELISELEKERPKVIVAVMTPTSWLCQPTSPTFFVDHLEKMLKEQYVLLGGTVRTGSQARWEEPLRPEDRPDSKLLLYRRK
ncbi:MAG TPA: hypothetical protein VMT55_01750, partial [Candidatus Sulfotelmatobacter sp.]|nr:hypothetical protein [Candidatus Sulfotelmatobacter sp.]